MSKKIVIIGGVAAGATAAARMRRLDEHAEIILFEKGGHVSFANCGLPYYIGGVIDSRDSLLVATKKEIESKYALSVRLYTEVLRIDKDANKVFVKNLETGEEYEESYDSLVVATGSKPIVPPLEGIDSPNVFTLWNMNDTDNVYEFIEENNPKKAVVVGGGFIGVEMAENLTELGIQVSLVEMADQVMAPFDKDMAMILENHMRQNGVNLYLGEGLESIQDNGKIVKLNTGREIEADLVMLSIGVRPSTALAKEAGLELNERGAVIVDDEMKTSHANIYAAGDIVEITDFNTGGRTVVPLAGPANKQGRLLCANVLGKKKEEYRGTQGTSIAKVFDLHAGSTGLNEKMLQRAGKEHRKDYFVALIHPKSSAGYYPGALPMTLKMIFDTEGKVLGVQVIGYKGVGKRVDVVATAIHFGATVYDLQKLELAYAPPFSSAKDPVNMLGYVGANMLEGLIDLVSVAEYKAMKEDQGDKIKILDIREKDETLVYKMPDAVEIPLTELRDRLDELEKGTTYVTVCAVGLRGYLAERVLKQRGFQAKTLMGGVTSYRHSFALENMAEDADSNDSSEAASRGSGAVNSGTTGNVSFSDGKASGTPSVDLNDADIESVSLLNVCGLSCPGPIVAISKALEEKKNGELVRAVATDPGFSRDIEAWCSNTGNTLIKKYKEGEKHFAVIAKGNELSETGICALSSPSQCNKEKTMIVFSGDLDKAIASFIIATGAAAMGNKVNMFFTFWGLSVLRKQQPPSVKKDFMGKMFSAMLPKGSKKLALSQMNFMGMGSKMIRNLMKKHNVDSLETLIQNAIDAGVKMTACQMSMDLMGLSKEELIDEVEVGGVAMMLNDNDNSNMNLFI